MAFLYYSPVTINTGQVPSPQTDFPILVSVTDTRFKSISNGGHVNSSSGFDIRPYSDSGITTAITGYELERYNASTGEVIMWVKRSSVSDGLATYLAYGDPTLTVDGSSTSTWSNSFQYVYHFKDGTTLSLKDSSGNGDLSYNSTSHTTAGIGQVDGGASFASANSQSLHTNDLSAPAAITHSCWVNATTLPNTYNPTVVANSGGFFRSLAIKSNGKMSCYIFTSTAATVDYDGTGTHTLSTGTWYYIAMTYNSVAGLVGYVNGSSDGTATANGTSETTLIVTQVGSDVANSRYWNGLIDEARVSTVARSADWVTTEYNNQSAPGTFETLGAEVSISPIGCLFKI